ncbi:MAG: catalase [Rhodospirillales bacterium]
MKQIGRQILILLFVLPFPFLSSFAQVKMVPKIVVNYPQADSYLGEKIGTTEVDDAAKLAANLSEKILSDYTNGLARRDAHPKAHGCVSAQFKMNDKLAPKLQAGIFQPGAKYDAIVRFSNGSPNASGDDGNGDTRGMAIKILGVEGEKLFLDPGYPNAVDLIQISAPYFFVNDSSGYTEFFRIANKGVSFSLLKIPFILGWDGTINAAKMMSQKISNPLDVEYFSVTPYQHGLGESRKAIKFSSSPCKVTSKKETKVQSSPNFLRHAMQDRLQVQNSCFDFKIQTRPDASFEVEDVVKEWDAKKAPFVSVAKIIIPKQLFDTAALNEACEGMTYNPWHTLAEHKPLGTINRMRRVVYQTISTLRSEMNSKH